MTRYTLSHLTDQALLRDLATLVARDRTTAAALLAHLAEVDARKLYLAAAYPSMFAWCVGELKLSEDAAAKRIQAARVARRFPAIFPALADGRLHLAAVCLLAPHLTTDNANDLIEASMNRTKAQVELLIVERFPVPDLVASIRPIEPASVSPTCSGLACETDEQHAPGHVTEPPRPRITPLSPQRFGLQLTIDAETHELLRDIRALLGHAIPSGDLAAVLRESLRLAKRALEKRRCAVAEKPRPGRRTKSARHIPAHVRREVWKRDQGRCTFVSDAGHRCESRTRIEFDHATPLARGGEATIDNLRLRCRAHNQYEAERAFGERFMAGRREQAHGLAETHDSDVIPWLRALGFTIAEARRAVARCDTDPGASLEERVKLALARLSRGRKLMPATIAAPA